LSPPARRWFFAPARDGAGWDLVEATRTGDGWEIRRPGRIAQETLPDVPPKGSDWKEVHAPAREPRVPQPRPVRPARARVPVVKAPAEPEPKPKPQRPKAVPGLSKALEGLLADEQMRQAAPAGMVKCPVCGLPLAPTRNRKVRTHDNPLTGSRCPASGTPWPT
jgi:hypothetical protein